MRDYYKILEVDRNASVEVIEKAHKVLSMKYHPDRQSQEKRQIAEEKMKLINEAYAVLSDPEKRLSYDAKLRLEKWKVFYEEGLIGLFRRYLIQG